MGSAESEVNGVRYADSEVAASRFTPRSALEKSAELPGRQTIAAPAPSRQSLAVKHLPETVDPETVLSGKIQAPTQGGQHQRPRNLWRLRRSSRVFRINPLAGDRKPVSQVWSPLVAPFGEQ
jgi:hypothetical protein